MQVHSLLSRHFDLKKRNQPSYSMRALARDLGASPSYLSLIFRGKRALPEKLIDGLVRTLEMDPSSAQQLRFGALAQTLGEAKSEAFAQVLSRTEEKTESARDQFHLVEKKTTSFLEHWYAATLLDLVECEGFREDYPWMAKRLGISSYQAEQAWKNILRDGLVEWTGARWQKVHAQIHVAAKTSQPTIRRFHRQMLQKACEELDTKTSPADYSNRSISGITVAIRAEEIPYIQERLNQFFHELVASLPDGDGQEVYQLGWQFFQLTQKS